ncbi:MAG: hypothetical protein WDW36_001247 [Sanguina aurantia]
MLFAARPGPKKLVGGKLTKDAAAALFEKYYGPDAVMEQILGGKRQLEPRSTATDASTRHRVVSTSSEVARPTAEESRLMEAAADEEVEGDITSRAKKETRSKNLPLGMQRKFAGNPFSNGSSKTKLTNIALLAGGAGKAAGGSSSPQPETASPLDYGGAVVVARAAAHVRAPQPGAARPAVRVQASSAGTLMDDGCRTSGQAAIAQLRGARKAVEMQPESKGVEVTDASTMPGAARAMHRLAADDGRSAIYTRPGSASFRGVTRDQSAAALTRSGSMSANAQQNVGGLAPPAGESIAGSRLGVGSMSRAGRHPNKSTSTRSTSGTGGGMDDGMNGWADGGDANQQLHQRGDDLYAGAHRVHARPSSAPGSSAFKAVPRPQLLADTTGSHLALTYFREGYDDMTRRATRPDSILAQPVPHYPANPVDLELIGIHHLQLHEAEQPHARSPVNPPPPFNFCQSHSRSGSRPSSGHRSGRSPSPRCRREAEDKEFVIQDDDGELGFDVEWA